MRQFAVTLLLIAGCEALEPTWSHVQGVNEVNPYPGASCDDICELQGELCLENSCDGATLATYPDPEAAAPDALVPAACETPLRDLVGSDLVGSDGGWQATISCCCTNGGV